MFISPTNLPSKLLPQIHQHPQQQKNHDLWNRVLVLEVSQKQFLAFPCCMGRIFFWSPCSVGMRFVTFATPPQRECDFFHFFNTSPARSSKIMKMQSSDHCFGVASSTARTANRYKNRILHRRHFFGPKIVLRENVRILSNYVNNP